jgi:hypothetical protein
MGTSKAMSGRAVIGGTEDIAEARSAYAKYVGN